MRIYSRFIFALAPKGLKTWVDALGFCEDGGARLCTLAELQNDEARGSGCGLDGQLVWADTWCSPFEYYLGYGATTGGSSTDCRDPFVGNPASVRCVSPTAGPFHTSE